MKLILNISRPDGTIFSKTFDSGTAPYVHPADLPDTRYIDGANTYEPRVIPANADDAAHPKKIGKKNLKKWLAAIDFLILFLYNMHLSWYFITPLEIILIVNRTRETPGCRGTVGHRQVSFSRKSLYSHQINKFK